jgi:hypothetical protein
MRPEMGIAQARRRQTAKAPQSGREGLTGLLSAVESLRVLGTILARFSGDFPIFDF